MNLILSLLIWLPLVGYPNAPRDKGSINLVCDYGQAVVITARSDTQDNGLLYVVGGRDKRGDYTVIDAQMVTVPNDRLVQKVVLVPDDEWVYVVNWGSKQPTEVTASCIEEE